MGLIFCWMLTGGLCAQDMREAHETSDTNNAVIEGRVTLPSGFSADRNVRITLRNSQSTLNTLYSNKHGEFQFSNLAQGVYYVEAQVDDSVFDPVIEKITLGRGIVWELTLQLREKKIWRTLNTGPRVISAAELHQSVPANAKKEYSVAVKLVEKGEIPQAAAHFERALSIFPEYLAARNDLGAQYLKLKRLDEAEQHFQSVLERDPKNFNAKFNLGLVRIEQKNYADAVSKLNEAIAIDSSRAVAYLWRGFALLEMGDLQNAESELSKSLIMGGKDCVAAHYHLARIYMNRGDNDEATRAVRAYLEESPNGEYEKEARELMKKLGGEQKRKSKK